MNPFVWWLGGVLGWIVCGAFVASIAVRATRATIPPETMVWVTLAVGVFWPLSGSAFLLISLAWVFAGYRLQPPAPQAFADPPQV